jgi:hypothetical protein
MIAAAAIDAASMFVIFIIVLPSLIRIHPTSGTRAGSVRSL